MIKITVPLSLELGRKKYYLNLNGYRNWHYIVNNKLKKLFKETIRDQLEDLSGDKIDYMEYKLYYPDRRKRDKMNYIAVLDKYFLDSMVECGVIEDDNDDYVGEVLIREPEIDRENPHCDILIK